MKDNFSNQSDQYAIFRPGYPKELIESIYRLVEDFDLALDCATGNGQIAGILSERFKKIIGIDISQNQIDHAVQKENIEYRIASAETSGLPVDSFDLITVGQAAHWFDHTKFYQEVNRLLKSNGVLAVIGYGLVEISSEVDEVVNEIYSDVLGTYWDPERKYIDEEYKTLPFPMKYVKRTEFTSTLEWTFDHLLGYLQTWSAVQHFLKKNDRNIVLEYREKLQESWGNIETRKVTFRLFVLTGRNNLPII